MEKYRIIKSSSQEVQSISLGGRFFKEICQVHIKTYGEYGANNIKNNVIKTFSEVMAQANDKESNHNALLVGKVQSGKTSNLELFTALAFDNKYNMVIIYGGYDNTLLKQTKDRFIKTFNIPSEADYSNDSPIAFTTEDKEELKGLDNQVFLDLIAANKPILLIAMKRPGAMNELNECIKKLDKNALRAFVIDDEGDQASLNTKKNKKEDASATYAAIKTIKSYLSNPLYLSVTATPQALIFQDEYSALRPESIHLLEPGVGYCGSEEFHLNDNQIIKTVKDNSNSSFGKLTDSLKEAIYHFIIATSIMIKRDCKTSDMIIHTHRLKDEHIACYSSVNAFIENFKEEIEAGSEQNLKIRKKELIKIYDDLFSEAIHKQFNFDVLWSLITEQIIKRIHIILENSDGAQTKANKSLRKYRIFIGGDLLQRGVTFPKLVTTYFTRWANNGGNMDTNLQRARWFGYRNKYLDISKIFTTSDIAREFTNLAEMEFDLWEQFAEVQEGLLDIDDVLVFAEDTKQKPTRSNVASYKTIMFKQRWLKQRNGVFDKSINSINNKLINDFKENHTFSITTNGRNSNQKTADFVVVNNTEIINLLNQIKSVLEYDPFNANLLRLLKDYPKIPVIFMNDNEGKGRERSFYSDNRIHALHQGRDNKNDYMGDNKVIVDESTINIQVHKIIPFKDKNTLEGKNPQEHIQYMFAFYLPKKCKYFAKKDDV